MKTPSLADKRASGRGPKSPALILALILLLGAFLRFAGLAHQSLWWDEAAGIKFAQQGAREIVQNLRGGTHPPLFYFLLKAWMRAFGSGETSVRALPAIFGLLLIPALYWTGSALFGRRAGLLAALVASVGAFHVRHSQDARPYTLLPLLGLLSLFFLYKAVLDDRALHWAGYALVMTATLYTHNYGVFIAASGVAFFMITALKQKVSWGKYFAAQSVVGLAYLPWVFYAARGQLGSPGIAGWIPGMSAARVWETFRFYSGLSFHLFRPGLDEIIMIAGGVVFSACFLAGVFSLKRRGRVPLPYVSHQAGLVLALCFLTVTLGLPMLISIWKPIYLPGRYSIAAWPAFVLVLGLGLAKLKRSAVLAAALVLILGVSSASLYWYHRVFVKAYDREIAALVDSQAGPNDVAVYAPDSRATPIEYYLRSKLKKVGFNSRGDSASETFARIMAQLTDPRAKIFFFNDPAMTWIPHMQELEPILDAHFRRMERRKYRTLVLTIYGPKPD